MSKKELLNENSKRKRLEARGWKVGTVEEFLGLTPEEVAYLEVKLALSRRIRELRQERKLIPSSRQARRAAV